MCSSKNTQAQYGGWRNIGRAARRDVFDALKARHTRDFINSFEDFDDFQAWVAMMSEPLGAGFKRDSKTGLFTPPARNQ